jgi:predicted DCC family thiol-disulfide oxidoreductase YuxK
MSTRPVLIYDGDCGFCRRWVERWRGATGDAVEYATSEAAAAHFPEIPREHLAQAVAFAEPDGRVTFGAEAVFRALATAPGRGWPLWLYEHVPGVAPASRFAYRQVASHRPLLSRVSGWLWGPALVPPGERFTTWLFLRLLAVIYAIAFASLAVQIVGLVGHDGILPARDWLAAVRAQLGAAGHWYVPTLFWFGAGDGALIGVCVAGTLLATLLFVGFAPPLVLAALWTCYLSLVSIGQDFLSFQWDTLLLEAGFVAFFLAPWRWWSRPASDPRAPRPARWLVRWLIFRLMFSSAAAKLASGDPTWRHLTALTFHYETQCLPPWTAWFAHHLPLAFQRFSCASMFAIEGLVPFLFFAPRRLRFVGAFITIGFQLLIAITGNYGFFNWLTIALCVPLLDDGVFRRAVPTSATGGVAPAWLVRPVAVVLIALSLVPLGDVLGLPRAWLGPLPGLERLLSPLDVVNRYGLFAVMTTRRLEISIEVSDDGFNWREYPFRWKPGDVAGKPAFVAPYHPRLDWQMWFAALSGFGRDRWFLAFCDALLRGSPSVRALMGRDPHPGPPPRYLRTLAFDYHFSDAATRRATGAWWTRELIGAYGPPLTLEDGRLTVAPVGNLP